MNFNQIPTGLTAFTTIRSPNALTNDHPLLPAASPIALSADRSNLSSMRAVIPRLRMNSGSVSVNASQFLPPMLSMSNAKSELLQIGIPSSLVAEEVGMAMEIIEKTIPFDERGPIELLKNQVSSGDQQLILARLNGQVVGVAMVRTLPEASAALVNYLAVNPNCQGSGVGSRLLGTLGSTLSGLDGNIQNIFLEIEKFVPEKSPPTNNEKRAQFYQKNGYRLLDKINYFGLNRETDEKKEYCLLYKPVLENSMITDCDLKDVISEILTKNYGVSGNLNQYLGEIEANGCDISHCSVKYA